MSIRMSSGLMTLRDQHEVNDVLYSQLKTLHKLGEGAFAVVEKCEYTAQDAPQAVVVAVKKLKPEITSDPTELEQFVREAILMRKLKHKYVVDYIGLGSQDTSSEEACRSTMFLVEEFCGGGTLKKMVSTQMNIAKRIYSNAQALRWMIQVAGALAYLHSANPVVIHRDLKMENILLTADKSEAKLADFGLAGLTRKAKGAGDSKQAALEQKSTAEQDEAYTQAAQRMRRVLKKTFSKAPRTAEAPPTVAALKIRDQMSGKTGTFMYMAPEMFKNLPYTEKVDVFSFGVIMYELFNRYLTVMAISNAGTEQEIENYAERIANGYRPPLDEEWPPAFNQLVRDCWHQDQSARPDMGQVVVRLQAIEAQGFPEGNPNTGCECCIS